MCLTTAIAIITTTTTLSLFISLVMYEMCAFYSKKLQLIEFTESLPGYEREEKTMR